MKHLIPFLILLSCAKEPIEEVVITTDEIVDAQRLRIAKAEPLMTRGWIDVKDCDAALWSYLAQSAMCQDSFDPRYSEKTTKGLFHRRPSKDCLLPSPDGGYTDNGSKSEWSGDMGKGLGIYSAACEDGDLIEDHIEAVKANDWFSGEAINSQEKVTRTYYRPSMQGFLYTVRNGLGGKYTLVQEAMVFPTLPRLTDFHAHLQMLSIEAYVRAKRELKISMKAKVKEHYKRDPKDPYFAVLYGIATGNYKAAKAMCAKPSLEYYGDYVRCKDMPRCELAHHLHACGLLLDFTKEM